MGHGIIAWIVIGAVILTWIVRLVSGSRSA